MPGGIEMRTATKYKGIRLGVVKFFGRGDPYYRARIGRGLAYLRIEHLDHEWLSAYVRWLKSAGLESEATKLRRNWLATKKLPVKAPT